MANSFHVPGEFGGGPREPDNEVAGRYFDHGSGRRVDTDAVIYEAIKTEHPGLHVVVTPVYNANLQAYASSGSAEVQTAAEHKHWPSGLKTTVYLAPAKRLDGGSGGLAELVRFEKFLYRWNKYEFLVYLVDGRDGQNSYPQIKNQYIVSDDPSAVATLIKTAGAWTSSLHDEIWVFDQGFWQKDPALYQAILKSHWEDVILDHSLKEDLIDTIQRFFDSREQYRRLAVPWKRGLIFYGPPGNGKTVSIKATMHTLYNREPPIPTLYVKSLKGFFGPEYSISQIFGKARQEAPCYLVFEDLDSMVTPEIRSFFLNAVDGLSENEGVLMIGSTNHLDQLDPGLAKRPSRFDRKYLFPDPNEGQRTRYAEYWQRKLSDNKDVEFPDKLCPAIAGITDGFSFAYMQEAFVSSLLAMASRNRAEDIVEQVRDDWELLLIDEAKSGNKDLEKYPLWKEIKSQVDLLRKEISKDSM